MPGLAKVVGAFPSSEWLVSRVDLLYLSGAKESEIAHTSTLTSNIHSLFISFYRPTTTRWRILIEKGAFPSDWVRCDSLSLRASRRSNAIHDLALQYAIHSHPKLHEGTLSSEQIDNAVVALEPRQGEEVLRTEDILATIEKYGDEVSTASSTRCHGFVVTIVDT